MAALKVTSHNVKGLQNEKKRRKLFNHYHEHKFDIILLQETHSIPENEVFWKAEWGGNIFFSHGSSNSRGVAILLDRKLNGTISDIATDNDGRIITVSIMIDGVEFAITSVYAPNSDDVEFFNAAFDQSENVNGQKIFAGDFNTVLDIDKDIKGGKGYSHLNCTNFVNQYMNDNDMLDIWRIQHPDQFSSTFVQKEGLRASALMERIDYILMDSSLHQFITDTTIMPAFVSDHANPVILLRIASSPPGPGFWKLNVKLLDDEKFINNVIQKMTDTLSDVEMDIFDRWELMKFSVKQCAIIRGSEIVKSDKNKLYALRKKLEDVTQQRDALHQNTHDFINLFNDHSDQITAISNEIDEIMSKRTEAAMMRCKANWYENAEKSSSYFHALEKRKFNKKTIHKIKNSKGDIVTNPKLILEVLNDYYANLFKERTSGIDLDYLALLDIPQIKSSDKYVLEDDIKLEEIHLAMKSMNKKKCPGTDGLP